jgi:RimJ/RimL family protein N-acetyltransferase
MSRLVVRPAGPEDVPRMADIHVAGYEDAYRGKLPDEVLDERTPELRRRVWSQRLAEERPREFVFVAEVDGVVQAFVSGRQANADEVEELDPAVGCWENMYSDPGVVGTAVGFRASLEMHKALEAAFRERGYREAVAFVLEGNDRAARFFELLGWRRDGTDRDADGATLHRIRRTFQALAPVGPSMEQSTTKEDSR